MSNGLCPDRPEPVRKELNRLYRALVRCTDQAECDRMEIKIDELEREEISANCGKIP